MKTLGIIGGLGPESTIDYYGKIIALYRERTGDGSYPQFIINSINLKKGLDFMEANNLAGMADYLRGGNWQACAGRCDLRPDLGKHAAHCFR